jgi:hypothetical protein
LNGEGRFTAFLRNWLVARVNDIIIKVTIVIPVMPSMLIKSDLNVGFLLLKSEDISENFSGDEFTRRGKSHAR